MKKGSKSKSPDREPVKSFTLDDMKAQRKAAEQQYRQRDVLKRLKGRRTGNPTHVDADIEDAAVEIEWLRAQKPDAVTRQELAAMAEHLREIQAVVAKLLERVER